MSYTDKIKDIYDMMAKGQMIEAFDKYYGDNVVMVDLGHGEPTVGKAANRERELAFVGMIEEFHGMGVDAVAADEENGITMVENWMDVTLKDIGRVQYKQVAVQRWEGDFIVDEKFYHK
jgi:hypothetical protein